MRTVAGQSFFMMEHWTMAYCFEWSIVILPVCITDARDVIKPFDHDV